MLLLTVDAVVTATTATALHAGDRPWLSAPYDRWNSRILYDLLPTWLAIDECRHHQACSLCIEPIANGGKLRLFLLKA